MEIAQAKIVVEAALLSSGSPLGMPELRRLFDPDLGVRDIEAVLAQIDLDWRDRGLKLVRLAGGWRFQTAPEVAGFLARLNPERPPRYSRAVLETLAIVAYRQPVTRGDIEDIRGVTVSTQLVRTLEERGWIEVIGHKDVVGRPALFATTRQFLDDLGLRSLDELPALADGQPSAPAFEALAQQVIPFLEGPGAAAMTPARPGESGAAAAIPDFSAPLLVGGASDQAQALDPGSPTEFETSVAQVPTPPKGTDLEH
jgi:segregation and condensation protein B